MLVGMLNFKYCEEVEEWLEPLTYDEVWRDLDLFFPGFADREGWDAHLKAGERPEDVLYVLKGMIRSHFVVTRNLKIRDMPDWMSLH